MSTQEACRLISNDPVIRDLVTAHLHTNYKLHLIKSGYSEADIEARGYLKLPTQFASLGEGHLQIHLPKILSFTLRNYPSCCGLWMMHAFNEHGYLPKEQYESIAFVILDRIWEHMSTGGATYWGSNRRLELIMVEQYHHRKESDWIEYQTAEGLFKEGDTVTYAKNRLLKNIPNIGKPIDHQLFYEYFKTKHIINERLSYNANSGNVLHNLEVIV